MSFKRVIAGILLLPFLGIPLSFAASPYNALALDAPADGDLFYDSAGSYSTAHDATAATTDEASGEIIAQNGVSGGLYSIRRGYMRFTTNLGEGGAVTVTSAVFNFYVSLKNDPDSEYMAMVGFTPSIPSNPVVDDYDLFGTTLYSEQKNLSAITSSAWNTINLNAAGIAALNLSGETEFGFRIGRDITNTAPSGNDFVIFHSNSEANDPYITITYTVGGGATQQTRVKIINMM